MSTSQLSYEDVRLNLLEAAESHDLYLNEADLKRILDVAYHEMSSWHYSDYRDFVRDILNEGNLTYVLKQYGFLPLQSFATGHDTYRVCDIRYAIYPEDVEHILPSPDDFALPSDYLSACEAKIDEITDALPSSLEFDAAFLRQRYDLDASLSDDEVLELLADAVADKTGWLPVSFSFEQTNWHS